MGCYNRSEVVITKREHVQLTLAVSAEQVRSPIAAAFGPPPKGAPMKEDPEPGTLPIALWAK